MKFFALLTAFSALTIPFHTFAEPFSFGSDNANEIVVNNRILANVNGKAISVIDLMKKMDMLFYREFPEYASSPQARFQFYQVNWKHVMQELVDKELIVADAEEAKLPISSGDVRQEMEHIFGPNIIANLDKIGMTFDEALKIVQSDLLIQRMLYVRVNTKAMRDVTPLDVRKAYEEFTKTNIRPAEWTYQVITIRNKDASLGAEAANIAHRMLVEEALPIDEAVAKIKPLSPSGKDNQITVSEEFKHNEKQLSEAYKGPLLQLSSRSYSNPIAQTSRADKSTVFRIFYLKEFKPEGVPPFSEVENQLKNGLLEKSALAQTTAYLKKLRRHFDVQEMVPEDFQPFALK